MQEGAWRVMGAGGRAGPSSAHSQERKTPPGSAGGRRAQSASRERRGPAGLLTAGTEIQRRGEVRGPHLPQLPGPQARNEQVNSTLTCWEGEGFVQTQGCRAELGGLGNCRLAESGLRQGWLGGEEFGICVLSLFLPLHSQDPQLGLNSGFGAKKVGKRELG